jgi:hypothetical protein
VFILKELDLHLNCATERFWRFVLGPASGRESILVAPKK